LIEIGKTISAAEYARARNAQHAFAAQWHRFMLDFDLALMPAMECPAFAVGRTAPESTGGVSVTGVDDDWCHFSYAFNLTGQPAISVPMGSVDGLPVGLQLVGRRWADDTVLYAAAVWQRACPWPDPALPTEPPGMPSSVVDTVEAAVLSGRKTLDLPPQRGLTAGLVVVTRLGSVRLKRVSCLVDGSVTVELDESQPCP
jgi:hypothetical protein